MNAEMRKTLHDALVKRLVKEGRLVEAGWTSHRANIIPHGAVLSGAAVEELRLAFIGGAQHVFFSIIGMLDAGSEPTEADLIRMDQIATELQAITEVLRAKARANGVFVP